MADEAANVNAHFDPKVLSSLNDVSSVVKHRDSGNARALEKSGELGKHNVSMYIQLRMAINVETPHPSRQHVGAPQSRPTSYRPASNPTC